MTADIILQNLGAYLPESATYSEQANAFLTNGYVSGAGNVYFSAVRLGEGIVVKEDVGQGHTRTFLNGLYVYSLKDKKLLSDRTFHCNFYSKEGVKAELKDMLMKLLDDAARFSGLKYDMDSARAVINRLIGEMFNIDQRQILEHQNKRLLDN